MVLTIAGKVIVLIPSEPPKTLLMSLPNSTPEILIFTSSLLIVYVIPFLSTIFVLFRSLTFAALREISIHISSSHMYPWYYLSQPRFNLLIVPYSIGAEKTEHHCIHYIVVP